MFCSRAFAFMALVLLKTRTLCKMHNTQKIYVGKSNKQKSGKTTEKSDSTIAQRLFFSDLFLSFYCFFIFFVLATQI